jgi:uncharacterized protein (TIGR02145 family)
MKAINIRNDFLKVTTFIVFTISLFSCTLHDEPKPTVLTVSSKPVATIMMAENVTETSATLEAYVTPMGKATVSFKYREANSTWKTQALTANFDGNTAIKVTLTVLDLKANTSYEFAVVAENTVGATTSSTSTFKTIAYTKAVVKIGAAQNVKISTATINAVVIPNQDNTEIFMEYQTANSVWASKSLGANFSGKDSVKVTLNLLDLQANMKYNFRVRTVNKASEETSTTSSFETYAVSDYDGNLYHTVTIGTQTWLRENFEGMHYANGDPIANVIDATTWSTLKTGAYCWYNNDSKLGNVYGGLYNYYVATDSRGLIVGWHTSNSDEWVTLDNYLGYQYAGLELMEAGKTHWLNPLQTGTNTTGFTALPSGDFALEVTTNKFTFMDLGTETYFWILSTTFPGATAEIPQSNCMLAISALCDRSCGFSIRLVKN